MNPITCHQANSRQLLPTRVWDPPPAQSALNLMQATISMPRTTSISLRSTVVEHTRLVQVQSKSVWYAAGQWRRALTDAIVPLTRTRSAVLKAISVESPLSPAASSMGRIRIISRRMNGRLSRLPKKLTVRRIYAGRLND